MPGENEERLMSGNQPEVQYAAFLAIDWADQKHVWSLQEANSSACERGEVDHMPEAVETWVAQLSQRFAGRPIAVAVEQSRGALVFMLSKYAQLHIFPVPPAMTANLRKAFYSSGAKSDPTDADLLLDLVQSHREKLRRLSPDTEATRLIQNLVEERRKLVDEKTGQSNRLEAQLKMYFPQIPHWFGDVGSPMVCALLERWPTLEALQKARPDTLRSFFRKQHCRKEELVESRIKAIGEAMPALKSFDRVHQRPAVVLRVAGKNGVFGQVAQEPQETGYPRYIRVGLARLDGLVDVRKPSPVVGACQFDIARERMLSAAIAGKRRFHAIQDCLQVRSLQDSVA